MSSTEISSDSEVSQQSSQGLEQWQNLKQRDEVVSLEEERCHPCNDTKPASDVACDRVNGWSSRCQPCITAGSESERSATNEETRRGDTGAQQSNEKSVASEEKCQRDPEAQQPTTVEFKFCRRCGMVKGRDAFGRCKRNINGLQSICRTCDAKLAREKQLKYQRRDDVVLPERKRCPRCAQVKPASDFSVTRTRLDGLHGHCKSCVGTYQKSRRSAANAETRRRDTAAQHPVTVEFKFCRCCGMVKGRDAFSPDIRNTDGLTTSCRACVTMRGWERRQKLQQRDNVVGPESKRCRRCDQVKPASDYPVCRSNLDGLLGHCKSCVGAHEKCERSAADEETLLQDPGAQRPTTVEFKFCRCCGVVKGRDAFSRNSRNTDGLHSRCRPCDNMRDRERRQKLRRRDNMVVPERQTCPRCDQMKPASDFVLRSKIDGLQGHCKSCVIALRKVRDRQKLLERVNVVVPESKRCPRCGQVRPASDFRVCRSNPDGLQYKCKSCACAYKKELQQRKQEISGEATVVSETLHAPMESEAADPQKSVLPAGGLQGSCVLMCNPIYFVERSSGP